MITGYLTSILFLLGLLYFSVKMKAIRLQPCMQTARNILGSLIDQRASRSKRFVFYILCILNQLRE